MWWRRSSGGHCGPPLLNASRWLHTRAHTLPTLDRWACPNLHIRRPKTRSTLTKIGPLALLRAAGIRLPPRAKSILYTHHRTIVILNHAAFLISFFLWEIFRGSNLCFADFTWPRKLSVWWVERLMDLTLFLYTTVDFVLTVFKNVKSDDSSNSSGSM